MPAAKKKVTKVTKPKKTTKRVVAKVTKKKAVTKAAYTGKKKSKVKNSTKSKPKNEVTKKKRSKKIPETVQLPNAAGARLESKAAALHEFIEVLHSPVRKISYVAAACFILVGIFTIGTEYLPPVHNLTAQTCQLEQCDIPDNSDQTDIADLGLVEQDTTDDGQTVPQPVFDFFDDVPNPLEGVVQISFSVQHAISVHAKLINLDTAEQRFLEPQPLSGENYRLILDSNNLEPAQYKVKVFAIAVDGQTQSVHVLGTFEVKEPIDTSSADTESGTEEDAEFLPQSDVNTDETVPDTTDITQDDEVLDDSPPLPDNELPKESDELIIIDVPEIIPLKVIFKNDVFRDREIIEVVTPFDFYRTELYARPVKALQSIFLGRMYKINRTPDEQFWMYDFDSNNLPNGRYEIIAVSNSEKSNRTVSAYVEVKNDLQADSVEVDSEEVSNQVQNFQTNLDTENRTLREFYRLPKDTDVESEDEGVVDEIRLVVKRVNQIIETNADDINDLLQRYAVSVQANDAVTQNAIREEIERKREKLLTEVITDGDEDDSVAEIDLELLARLDDLRGRVDVFEEVRRSRSGDIVRSDSDGDGISDFDELNVYKTDPNKADSDNDGFIDGAEVARGYDPNNPEPEAIIDFELPTEVIGLKRVDVLEVTSVTSVVYTNSVNEEVENSAQITGVGLPNSYVTLYIFSSPVIVTVKTDEDGSFVYRFDKELEDGEHEVFVAFTDNTGAILAHSEPFQFVKRAQAFTPVDAEVSEVVSVAPTIVETSTTNTVKIVLGMSVLVLGFILMMFGIYLRQNEPVVENITAEDDKATD